jgi:hypothetical protein
MDVYRGELAVYHPRFSKDSQAACVESLDAPLGPISRIFSTQPKTMQPLTNDGEIILPRPGIPWELARCSQKKRQSSSTRVLAFMG